MDRGVACDFELLTAEEMCQRLKVNRETFRHSWRRWRHLRVGQGDSLRSVRFYWGAENGPVDEGLDKHYGNRKVQNQKRRSVHSGRVSERGTDTPEIGLPQQGRCGDMGEGSKKPIDLDAEAKRLGLAPGIYST